MNHCSENLIQLDDGLREFDPLAEVPSNGWKKQDNESETNKSYSSELLGNTTNAFSRNSVISPFDDDFASMTTSKFFLPKQPVQCTEQRTVSKSNKFAIDLNTTEKNQNLVDLTHSQSAHASITTSSKSIRSLVKSVSNSTKSKISQKSQSQFFDTTQETTGMESAVTSKTLKKSQTSFRSYVDARMDTPALIRSSATLSVSQKRTISSNTHKKQNGMGNKEELLLLLMAKRQDDFTSKHPFRIFVGTWNVNGQAPPYDVHLWTDTDSDPPDVYVIGFQELDLSKEAFVLGESSREEEWYKVVSSSLHPKASYSLVKLIRLVGMMLLVFVAKQHAAHITHVRFHQVGTGLLGKMGNKGGVGVRFNLHSTTVCVVNTHLAAHLEMTQKRNEDYTDICSRMRFLAPDNEGYVSIFEHDVLIWLGDLNYRIEGMLSDMVKECIKIKHYGPLIKNDQLQRQRDAGKVFHNFEEGDLTFQPTYKYDPGTDLFDSREKGRIPAWCDRVLWREAMPKNLAQKNPEKSLTLLEYRSHPQLKLSDHKPVSALFDLKVKVIERDRYRKVYNEEMKRLDQMENERLPSMAVSTQAIDFGAVRFQKPAIEHLELQNTGFGICHFEFIAKPGESSYCKRWLSVSKSKGYLLPGDKIDITFEIFINKSAVTDLNSGKEKLDDILVLHLVDGKDFFITVNGRFVPTCFGLSIESLCRMKKPVREMEQSSLLALSKISPIGSNKMNFDLASSPIPKELWRLLDHLYRNALQEPFLFQQRGLHVNLHEIQEVLDTTLPLAVESQNLPGTNHSVAEALLVFLEALPEPIIPFCFYSQCLDFGNESNFAKSKHILKSMSSSHFNVFLYLMSFLQELLAYQFHNDLTVSKLGDIFFGYILRPAQPKAGIEGRIERQKAKNFVENYLVISLDDLVP